MNQQIHPDETEEADVPVDISFLLGTGDDPESGRESFRIGDLSREFGVTLRTLRFYEDRGLLSPERRGTTCLYSRRDRARLRLVLLAKTLGFSLTEAKQIIEIYDQPNGPRRQMEVALERFEQQHEVLQDQRREIDASIRAMEISIEFVRSKLDKPTSA